MVKLIHADGFFPPGDAEKYVTITRGINFVEKQYGYEIEDFNVIFPKIEPVLGKVLGERVIVDHKRSGIFRRPMNNVIHFEEFDSLNEWCFIVALEKNTLNLLHHLADFGKGEYGKVDARTALEGYKFNYRNLFEWDIHTNVLLEPNQGVFIRPWVFHSLNDGLVQYYRLISDKKFRVLVMGLPGSNRSLVASKLAENITNSKLIKSKTVREELKDIDFTYDGRMRQTYRLLTMCRDSREDCVIVDMVCPLPEMREILNPDVIVWVNDQNECLVEEVNQSFVPPKEYDLKYKKITDEVISEIIEKIQSKRI